MTGLNPPGESYALRCYTQGLQHAVSWLGSGIYRRPWAEGGGSCSLHEYASRRSQGMTWHISTPAFQHAGQESCHVLLHLRALWQVFSCIARAGSSRVLSKPRRSAVDKSLSSSLAACTPNMGLGHSQALTAAARLHEGKGV